MFKNFFYFPKGQRIAILVLLGLILIVFGLNLALPLFEKDKEETQDTDFIAKTEAFMHQLQSVDSLKKIEWAEKYERKYEKKYPEKFIANERSDYQLFNFNPNKADSLTFSKLGLSSRVISNILKYRNKGGRFLNPEAFSKVYGISEKKFSELKPYIKIDETAQVFNKPDSAKNISKKQEVFTEKLVDINTADTTELMTVKGIGRKYAKGIVKYRSILGGYYAVEQVREVYGMTPENFDKINSKLTVNASLISKIDVNEVSVERLKTHPYLNFYQAKAVYELRRRKGKLKNISELNHLTEFTPEQLAKIQPYFNFK